MAEKKNDPQAQKKNDSQKNPPNYGASYVAGNAQNAEAQQKLQYANAANAAHLFASGVVNPIAASNGQAYTSGLNYKDFSFAPNFQGAARDQQQVLAGMMFNTAQGKGPSQAQMMLQRERQNNIADAMSMMRSQPGINPALAARMVSDATAKANADAGFQGAMLRNQEMLGAQQMYGQLLSGMRGQDIDNAGMSNQSQLALWAQKAQQAAFNAQQQQDASFQNAGLNQQANLANADIQRQNINQQAAAAQLFQGLGQQGMDNIFRAQEMGQNFYLGKEGLSNQKTGIWANLGGQIAGSVINAAGNAVLPQFGNSGGGYRRPNTGSTGPGFPEGTWV